MSMKQLLQELPAVFQRIAISVPNSMRIQVPQAVMHGYWHWKEKLMAFYTCCSERFVAAGAVPCWLVAGCMLAAFELEGTEYELGSHSFSTSPWRSVWLPAAWK